MLKMADLDLKGKKIILREDLNVPLTETGEVANANRIEAALPTIKYALEKGAAVIILSHLGRPQEGVFEQQYSLLPVKNSLEKHLSMPVKFIPNWLDGFDVSSGEVVLCENVRFCVGEKANDTALAKSMAAIGDIFVMDAFAAAHRAHASTVGIAKFANQICAGPLLLDEVNSITQALYNPRPPVMAIVGGAKVSGKLEIIESLIEKTNFLLLGGGIANTFLKAKGFNIGNSLHENELIEKAKLFLAKAEKLGCKILLPTDVVVAKEFSRDAKAEIKQLNMLENDDLILDVGPKTINYYESVVAEMGTIIWNGPVGVFEIPAFANGTEKLAKSIAKSSAYSIAGGGDTVSAIEKFGVKNAIDKISTGGGAFLEMVEGKTLPGVAILENN